MSTERRAIIGGGLAALDVLLLLLVTAPAARRVDAVQVLGAGLAGAAGSSTPRYVMAGQPALLECRFSLEPQETLQGVTWTKDAHLVYRWLPGGRVSAFGPLENSTAPASLGWDVRVLRATLDMAGNYSCSVHTDHGSATSRRFQLPVLLVCKARIETEDSTGVNCTVGWRVTCARLFPDLNLTAGVFDPERNTFIDRVTEWTKVVYSDRTFGYHAFKSYHIAEIPKTSVFLWSLSYLDQIPLVTGNVSSGAVHRSPSGCPAPPVAPVAGLQVRLVYDGEVRGQQDADCRGQPRGATRALYTCANEIPGIEDDQDRPEEAAVKELTCADGEWLEEDPTQPWPSC